MPGPEHQTAVSDGHLLLRLPRRGLLLRVALRRTSLLGAHRFTAPVHERSGTGWRPLDWRRLATYTHDELTLRTGVRNPEFLHQVDAGHRTLAATLATREAGAHAPHGRPDYLASERSLLFGHRFHPTPKARTGDTESWRSYAPEDGASFPLRASPSAAT